MRRATTLALVVAAALLSACGDGTGPGSTVSLSFATRAAGSPAPAASGLFLSSAGAAQTLIIDKVEVVLREIELERVEVVDCDVEPEPAGCEDFETGPVLINLPLTAGAALDVTVDVEPGVYDEVEFDVHKVSGNSEDAAFVAANPQMDGKSIRVTGTFDGVPFEFSTDLDEEQEYALVPPLDVAEQTSTNVTVLIDVSTWFVDGLGNTIDPSTANKDGANENLVKDNIKASIDAFEDKDRDGDDTDES